MKKLYKCRFYINQEEDNYCIHEEEYPILDENKWFYTYKDEFDLFHTLNKEYPFYSDNPFFLSRKEALQDILVKAEYSITKHKLEVERYIDLANRIKQQLKELE